MKTKKAFGLLTVLILLLSFSYLSINILQNHSYSSQINKEKYLHIQAQIHMKYVKIEIEKLELHDDTTDIDLHDNRFKLQINTEKKDNKLIYHIYIQTKGETHIRLYESILKDI